MADKPKKRRPGGRSQQVQSAVLTAAAEILYRVGYAGFRITEVAEKAGVNETSIYRRWGTKEALLLEMLTQRAAQSMPAPDSGSLRTDLLAFVRDVVATAQAPLGMALIEIGLLSTQRADLAPFRAMYWERRSIEIRAIFERAVSRHELQTAPEPALVMEFTSGPILARLLISGEPLTEDFTVKLVDHLLRSVVTLNGDESGHARFSQHHPVKIPMVGDVLEDNH